MGHALLSLNDLALRWQSDSGVETEAVGIAYQNGQGVDCGDRAWSALWLEPQHCYSQYWQQFNQNALVPPRAGVRHHADLVFHQLQQLYGAHDLALTGSGAASDAQLLVCAPSHFREQELALLLAVMQSLQLPVVNFVDSAVAAAAAVDAGSSQRLLYVDMQLHQTQIVEVIAGDGLWRRGAVIPLGDCGLLALLNSAAHFVADRFIDQHRFDPLKLAASSQYLYTLIATSLLESSADFTVELESGEGRLNCTIDANSWRQMLAKRLQSLLRSVQQELAQGALCLHHNSQWLQGLFDSSVPLLCVADRQIGEYLFQHWPESAAPETVFIDALSCGQVAKSVPVAAPPASHLLFNNVAYALAGGLWFSGDDQDLQIHTQVHDKPLLALTLEPQGLQLCWQPSYARSRGLDSEQVLAASIGQTISLHRQQLTLIALAEHTSAIGAVAVEYG